MKILQVLPYADPKLGGQERHVLTLSKILASFGHEVTILTCRSESQRIQNFKVRILDVRNLFGLPFFLPNKLIDFLLENLFDVCHLHHQTVFGESVLLANKICRLPTVTTLHSQMIRRFLAKFFYDRVSLRLISTLSSKVICLSQNLMQDLVRRGLKHSKCVVIPNAVDVHTLKEQFRKLSGELTEAEFDILFVGRLEERKGVRLLLNSLSFLHKKGSRYTLRIVGHGPLTGELHKIILASNLSKYVKLLGYVPRQELLKCYLLAKVVVVPSLYEGVPTVALEAMVANKPLVVSNIPGLNELVVNGINGFTVNPTDIPKLAYTIDRILTDSPHLRSLDRVNANIISRFDWNVVARKILEVYNKALDDR